MAKKKTAKRKTAKKKTAKRRGTKTKLNKSAAIRDYKKAHPKMTSGQIATALSKKHGVDFSPNAVATILSKEKTAKKNARGRKVKNAKGGSPTEDLKAASGLMAHAVELVLSAGAKEAKSLVESAEGLVARIRKN